jgi:hypothetical protein
MDRWGGLRIVNCARRTLALFSFLQENGMRATDQLSLAVFTCTLLLVLMFFLNTTSCQSGMAQRLPQRGPQQSPPVTNSGIWYGGSNLGTLTAASTSVIQPAPQLTQAGSYMFVGNVSLQETTGGYPQVSCFIEVGGRDLLQSNTRVQPSTWMNLTTTGAITLTSTQVPATASLQCSHQGGTQTINVTQASLSIFSVGSLQTGP